MLRYDYLKDRPCDFLAATGLSLGEFTRLLPAFEAADEDLYPRHLTAEGAMTSSQVRIRGISLMPRRCARPKTGSDCPWVSAWRVSGFKTAEALTNASRI